MGSCAQNAGECLYGSRPLGDGPILPPVGRAAEHDPDHQSHLVGSPPRRDGLSALLDRHGDRPSAWLLWPDQTLGAGLLVLLAPEGQAADGATGERARVRLQHQAGVAVVVGTDERRDGRIVPLALPDQAQRDGQRHERRGAGGAEGLVRHNESFPATSGA